MNQIKLFALLGMMMTLAVATTSAVRAAPDQPIILGYYSNSGAKHVSPQNVKYQYFNYICRAFFTTDTEGKMSYDTAFDHEQFVATAHKNGTNVLLSLGGGGNGDLFGQMVTNDKARQRYVQEVLAFAQKYHYDGVDIDWEFPKSGQQAVLMQLVKELHGAFKAWRDDTLITIAVPAGYWSVPYDIAPQLMPYIDFWNIMTYDFHGPWSTHAGLLSALFPTTDQPADCGKKNMEYSLNYWLQRGVPKEKILLGIPGYGYGFATKAWGTKTGEKPKYNSLGYRQILPLLDTGWVKHWDDQAKVPWLELPGENQRITYEDPQSVRLKAQWAKEQGIAGVFFWEISQDYLNGDHYLVREAARVLKQK